MLTFLFSCLLDGRQLGNLMMNLDLGTYSERKLFPAACTELEEMRSSPALVSNAVRGNGLS
jgi:hypothetical protein